MRVAPALAAVEARTSEVVILEDDWTAVTVDHSRSAQVEHTVLITEDGCEILTENDWT